MTRGSNPIDATQAGALRQFARAAQSAVNLLGNPQDPGHAFAMTFVNGLVSDVQQGLNARELQGTGPWSDGGYRNGSDIASDLAAERSGSAASAAWTWGPDQSAAEETRLGRAPLPQPELPTSPAADSEAATPPVQTIVIIGNRPPGAAVDVVLPEALEAASTITDQGTPTQLLTGDAASMALLRLGVGGATLDAMAATAAAAGRLVLYAGTRAVGYFVPGVGLLLTAETVYQIFDSAMSSATGVAFTAPDGSVQRYAPAADGGLYLQTQVPQEYGSPNSPEEQATWVTIGKVTPLTDEERARMLRPMTTPMQPHGPGVMSHPIPDGSDRPELRTPGYEAQPGAPTSTTTPGVALDWRDLLTEQSNSENNRELAQQRYRDNPTLRDPSSLAGQVVPGVGTWGYPNTPRGPSGADYAEQLHGVPAGLELNVGGAPNAQGVITGGAWLDGIELRNGQTTLIDRKDWVG